MAIYNIRVGDHCDHYQDFVDDHVTIASTPRSVAIDDGRKKSRTGTVQTEKCKLALNSQLSTFGFWASTADDKRVRWRQYDDANTGAKLCINLSISLWKFNEAAFKHVLVALCVLLTNSNNESSHKQMLNLKKVNRRNHKASHYISCLRPRFG